MFLDVLMLKCDTLSPSTDLFESPVVRPCEGSGSAVVQTGDDGGEESASHWGVATTLLIERAEARLVLGLRQNLHERKNRHK